MSLPPATDSVASLIELSLHHDVEWHSLAAAAAAAAASAGYTSPAALSGQCSHTPQRCTSAILDRPLMDIRHLTVFASLMIANANSFRFYET